MGASVQAGWKPTPPAREADACLLLTRGRQVMPARHRLAEGVAVKDVSAQAIAVIGVPRVKAEQSTCSIWGCRMVGTGALS
jgi:hypothetical protein